MFAHKGEEKKESKEKTTNKGGPERDQNKTKDSSKLIHLSSHFYKI
jgi:hypothetical protein